VDTAAETSKDATVITKLHNEKVKLELPFSDDADYRAVRDGLVEEVQDLEIKADDGKTVIWSLAGFKDQMTKNGHVPPCPPTVNPSLWRVATLNCVAGLFQVTPGVYQVRAYDLSNMSIIEGPDGLIVIDPLISTECAKAALALYGKHATATNAGKPVKAVIHTHSHVDHFGGVAGLFARDDERDAAEIVAPDQFLENAASENVYAGTAMARRSQYMYGLVLDPGDRRRVDCGLGKGDSSGTISLLPPTTVIKENGEYTIAGVTVEFQLTPGTEAPAEMNFYFPDYGALCGAENSTHNMHNLQTLRGARVRDPLAWSKYLHEAIDRFGGRATALFTSHHWPVQGQDALVKFLRQPRDLYRYMNDQTLRLLNKGYTGIEIAEGFSVPPALDKDWALRGYYGSLSHNVKGRLRPLHGLVRRQPGHPARAAPEQVRPEVRGGDGRREAVIVRAAAAFALGDYRWAAQLLSHVVYAHPDKVAARKLQADAFEQLGYQNENATWRNFYLVGAQELRTGVASTPAKGSADMMAALTNEMIFDMFGANIDGPHAAERPMIMNWSFDAPTPTNSGLCTVEFSNGALSYTADKHAPHADVEVWAERKAIDGVLCGTLSLGTALKDGQIKVRKGFVDFIRFFSFLDHPDPNFPIVTPRQPDIPSMSAQQTAAPDEKKILDKIWHLAHPPLKGC
jgi:alkyl sulfatase BDS1-like metallo-beta-lactamase superfamily hydrolase